MEVGAWVMMVASSEFAMGVVGVLSIVCCVSLFTCAIVDILSLRMLKKRRKGVCDRAGVDEGCHCHNS